MMTLGHALKSTAGDDIARGAKVGSSCCCGTGDLKALIVDGDDKL